MAVQGDDADVAQEVLLLRATIDRFASEQMVPHEARWRGQHHVDRETWLEAGALGILCADVPAEYGGGGGDLRHEAVLHERLGYYGVACFGAGVHGICAQYVLRHGTEEQKRRWLPRLARGELIGAIAMTEPDAGSDLQAIRCSARREGDHYRVNGSKTFITNGGQAGLVALVVKTDTAARASGMSILLVEPETCPGYRVGRILDKMGLQAQDTAELYFDDMRVPVDCLLGGVEGQGFYQLMSDLPYERMLVALTGVGAMAGGLDATVRYAKERQVFGRPLAEYQNTRFQLAEAATLERVARTFVEDCVRRHVAGTLDSATAAMAKWWVTDMQQQVLDTCVQIHGGSGYMMDTLVCRMYADSRVQRIYGGTNEIMKELIARAL